MGQTIQLKASDGFTFDAYVAGPADATSGIVVIQEIFGVNHHIRDMADRFAAAGWAQGVRASLDGGKTWRDSTRGLPSTHITALAFDPTHPGRLWASTFEEGTYYSDNFGKSWKLGGLYGAYVVDLRFL